MTDPATLETLAADVDWTDAYAGTVARSQAPEGAGRLADLVEWLAATQGTPTPAVPSRPRALLVDATVTASAAWLAQDGGVALRAVPAPATAAEAFAAGVALADTEVDEGVDLLVVAGPDPTGASAALTGLLTGAEPVALLPRGAAAVDTRAWIARVETLRTARSRIAGLRSAPDDLLAALRSPALALATGLILRAVARRTPVLLDGPLALGAALLCHDVQPRAGRWWRVADTSDDPVHRHMVAEFGHEPVLGLGTSHADGTAGLLAVAVVRAATTLVPGAVPHDEPVPEQSP